MAGCFKPLTAEPELEPPGILPGAAEFMGVP